MSTLEYTFLFTIVFLLFMVRELFQNNKSIRKRLTTLEKTISELKRRHDWF